MFSVLIVFIQNVWVWFVCVYIYILLEIFQHSLSSSLSSILHNLWQLFTQILPLPHFLSPSRTLDPIHVSMCLWCCFSFKDSHWIFLNWIVSSAVSNLIEYLILALVCHFFKIPNFIVTFSNFSSFHPCFFYFCNILIIIILMFFPANSDY